MGRRRQRHRLGAGGLHRVEALPAALEQDADQVDHDVGVARGRLDRAGIAQIGLHGVDLADPAERLQMAGEIGPAHRDADAVAALGQRAHHVAAEEARAAEDGDQRVERDCAVMPRSFAWTPAGACDALPNTGSVPRCIGAGSTADSGLTRPEAAALTYRRSAQVAELVDALVSGTSGESRGGSSPLLGTKASLLASAMATTFVGPRANDAASQGRCVVPWIFA